MKRLFFSLLAVLPFAVSAQLPYTLEGKIGEWNSPSKVYLYYMNAKGEHHFDSSEIHQGHFEFHGTIDEVRKGSLFISYRAIHFKFFMEPMVKVKNEEDFKNFGLDVLSIYVEPGTTELHSADSLYKAIVSGTPLNTDLSALNQRKAAVANGMKGVISRFNVAANERTLTAELSKALDSEYLAGLATEKRLDLAFVKEHPASPVSLDVLTKYIETEPAGKVIEPLYNALSATARNSAEGKEMKERIAQYKLIDIGATAPTFTQTDTAGKPVSLSSYRGKYVLVDFWASWCSPCRAENPNIVYSYRAFKNKNFAVLGISLDRPDGKEKWLKAIADDHLDQWAQLSDLKGGANAVATLYHVSNIPQNFLVGPDGKIVARNLHGADLQQKLAALLN